MVSGWAEHDVSEGLGGVRALFGLRAPDSLPACDAAFVVAAPAGEARAVGCAFMDGAEVRVDYPAGVDDPALARQLEDLLARDWKWMPRHDVWVVCHGMGNPADPFWARPRSRDMLP